MTYYYLIAPAAVVRENSPAFTYESTIELAEGTVLQVPVGKKTFTAVVIEQIKKPQFATKPVGKILTNQPVPAPLIRLAFWLSEYYCTHLGIVLQAILPTGLQKQRKLPKSTTHPSRDRIKIVLNPTQKAALEVIKSSKNQTILLHGVTGSGKTQVYIESVREQLTKGKSAIVLVPEISLTPQLVAEFSNHFKNLIVTHSAMTEAARHLAWVEALQSIEPTVVIGPRSALFLPLKNVGIIVIDECHEPSYKQDMSPKYSSLRAASVLAKEHGANLVLGSATPSVADFYLADEQNKPIVILPKPISGDFKVEVVSVDLKKKENFKKHRFVSDELVNSINETLQQKKQVLLFHNRRGTAPTTICSECGWIANCPECFLPLTLHADKHILMCHLCGHSQKISTNCPTCSEPTIIFKGIGTKMIETEVARLFPKARIARFDADTKKEDALHNRYQQLYDGEVDIIIGTQILAKGLDLPKLDLVGVIQADSGLMLPDYTANERVFQLLYQVMGRVGRVSQSGKVVVQSFQPEHPIIVQGTKRDFAEFYKQELALRQKNALPPYSYLLKLTCSYKTETSAITASQKLANSLRSIKYVKVLGPTPSFYERLGGNYRWQIVVKSRKRDLLTKIVKDLSPKWQFDLDPISLL
ncbi:MAG TPA: primosomal protein N' [Candidatus Saccharimonadales bacterium]|nr:primosomal protein N' [Candidatus Saccharimonadales bacterium]